MTRAEHERNQKMLMQGLCSCGNPIDGHGTDHDTIRSAPFHCSLTKGDILKWHTPREITE